MTTTTTIFMEGTELVQELEEMLKALYSCDAKTNITDTIGLFVRMKKEHPGFESDYKTVISIMTKVCTGEVSSEQAFIEITKTIFAIKKQLSVISKLT